jgi:hypothetical protein
VIVPAEWFLADEFSESVEIIITVLVAAVGGFLGAQLARRFAGRQRRELT